MTEALKQLMGGGWVPYSRALARALGDPLAAILVGEIAFRSSTQANELGWLQLGDDEIEQELLLTARQMRRLRTLLGTRGEGMRLVHHRRRGQPARMEYLLDYDRLSQLLQNVTTRLAPSDAVVTKGHNSLIEEVKTGEDLAPGRAPAREADHSDTVFELPEWLEILRRAEKYDLTQALEVTLMATAKRNNLGDDALEDAARSIESLWPYKKYKSIGATFINWAKGNAHGRQNGRATGLLGNVQQRGGSSGERKLVTARRPGRE